VIDWITVDLPAFGSPTSPTSATSLSSIFTSRILPLSPSSAKFGAWRVLEGKWAFPNPPRPPSQIWNFCPGVVRSQITDPSLISVTRVPTGTSMIVSGAVAPWHSWVPPFSPSAACMIFWWRNFPRVVSWVVATSITFPPFPPSPPNGPHFGIYFSRLQEMIPSPHLPARSDIFTSSMNIIMELRF